MKIQISVILFSILMLLFGRPSIIHAQDAKDKGLIEDASSAKVKFISSDGLMQNLFKSSYGYVILPNIGKGAIGVGVQQETELFMFTVKQLANQR